MQKWFIANKKADFRGIADKYGISPLTARLLRNRNVVEDNDIDLFLNGGIDDLYNPECIKDLKKGADIVINDINQNKKIRVVSDYDVDGCMSGYILIKGLKKCGANVDFDIPLRTTDGYGINERIVNLACKDGVDTIITCDNGIAAFPAAEAAKELGITFIITDHHDVQFEENNGERKYIVPCGDAVINPKQPDDKYPYKNLCGAGVALKFIQYIYNAMGIDKKEYIEFIQFAAIATVCDIVELNGENRVIAREGLKILRQSENYGLKALIDVNELVRDEISYYHIGFILGPCINAAGRLETAKIALNMLLSENYSDALKYAIELKMYNDSRKAMTKDSVDEGIKAIDYYGLNDDTVLVVYIEQCHESVAGIVAGRLRERYYKPVIVLTPSEDIQYVKGSGRSIEGYNIFEELLKLKDILVRFGGHPMAAGLTIKRSDIDSLRERLNRNCSITPDDMVEKVQIDAAVPIGSFSFSMIDEIRSLEPFGKANKKPLFAEKDVSIVRANVIGKNKNVLKLVLKNCCNSIIDGVYFGDIELFKYYISNKFGNDELDKMFSGIKNNVFIDIVYYPNINSFGGENSIQLTIEHYR